MIRERRISLNYSQEFIADKIGVHQSQYSRFENGEGNISISSFLTLLEQLDYKLETTNFNNPYLAVNFKSVETKKELLRILNQIFEAIEKVS